MDIATPVALQIKTESHYSHPHILIHLVCTRINKRSYLRCVGNTSVIKQSNEAFPHAMTPVNMAETIKFCCLLITKYMPAAQMAADTVLNIMKNFRPNLSMKRTAIKLAGNAADKEINDSLNTELEMVAEHAPNFECEPMVTTYSVTWHTDAD